MGPEWKKSSPELTKVLDAALLRFTCDKRPMFGSPVFWINRNMFAGVHGDNIFIRLSQADRDEIAKKFPGSLPFEPLKGRVMKEYVVVPQSLYADAKELDGWLRRAHAYAASLPPKVKKSIK
jgi:TfoX/Sxy family transcriptional regulator of competence genes